MSFKEILPQDLVGKGNIGKPDTPGVSTAEMQRILDEIPREVIIPAFNELVKKLNGTSAAGSIGATIPGDLPISTPKNVQAVMAALLQYIKAHEQKTDNPHDVSASQVGAYTKEETEQAISDRVNQIGSADMNKSEYGGSGPGIVRQADNATSAENAEKLGGYTPSHYAISDNVKIYTATFRMNSWTNSGGTWTQTAACTGMRSIYSTSPPWVNKTGYQSTDESLQDALNQLNDGLLESMNGYIKATLYAPPPSNDVQIYMRRTT